MQQSIENKKKPKPKFKKIVLPSNYDDPENKDVDEKGVPLPIVHKTLAIQTKIRYKTFVNIGND